MKGLHSIWFALILLALLAALTLWIDRTVQAPPPKRDGSTRHDPDYIVNNFSSMRTDPEGNPRYTLSGVDMRHFPDNDTTELVKPFYRQFMRNKPNVQVQGERGLVSPNGENVYFMDNVKMVRAATAQKGEMTLLTEFIHIVPDQGLLKTDRPVTILQAPKTVVHATGMEYYKNERILKLFNRVRAHYERPDARNPAAAPAKPQATVQPKAAAKASSVKASKKANSQRSGTGKKSSQKTLKAKQPETKAGQTKTRIRRDYANPA